MDDGDGGGGTFGGRLRHRRVTAGLSQEALAERAGLSVSAISALERGERRRPYPHTVQALANALGLDDAERAAFVSPPAAGGTAPFTPTDTARLPTPATHLVGREVDVAAVTPLLCRRAETATSPPPASVRSRLVTLTGPGGVGKTRLALAVAAQLTVEFPDGVAFVPLAPLADPALVVPAIAQALGVRESGGRPLTDALRSSLRARRILLLLDNCEHLLAVAPAIAELLATSATFSILATSRAPLRLSGEQEYPVVPLGLPAFDHIPTLAEVAVAPAVRLFLARAQGVAPAFALTESNAPTVAAICRRLDGLPLALELAAAWVKLLPPTALLARLDRAVDLPAAGPRDLPARQRTLRDTVAWSHNLLAAREQVLFRRLAVFTGGWTLDAATVVAVDATLAGELAPELVALEGVAALLDKSLLVQTVAPSDDAEPRYEMLATIRAFALERLTRENPEPGEERSVLERHAAYFLAVAERAEFELYGAEQRAWFDLLEREADNLRAALDWLLGQRDAERAATLSSAMAQFWAVRGHLDEGQRWLKRALADGDTLSARAGARARSALAGLVIGQARFEDAAALVAEALPLARASGDRATLAGVLAALGFTEAYLGRDETQAAVYTAEAVALYRELDYGWGVGSALLGAALAALGRGQAARAEALLAESEAQLREAGSWWYLAGCLIIRTQLALTAEDGVQAAALSRDVLAVSRRIGDTTALAPALTGLAGALALMERHSEAPRRAARLFGAAEALRERTGAALDVMSPRALYERHVALVRASLQAEAFTVAWESGRAEPLDVVVAEALTNAAGDTPSTG